MSQHRIAPRRGRPKKPNRDPGDGKSTVLALDRGLRALLYIADCDGATLTGISKETDIPVATCHRLLATLGQRGMAKYIEATGEWEVGPQAYRVGLSYRKNDNLLQVATPIMQRMSKETGETSNVAVEDDGELLYLAQVESDNPVRASIKNGAGNHFNTSGVGKVIMAFMDQTKLNHLLQSKPLARQTENSICERSAFIDELVLIKRRGWALDDEERFAGMRCIAGPVFDPSGGIVAGVSISGPSTRFPDQNLSKLADSVTSAAREISDRLKTAAE